MPVDIIVLLGIVLLASILQSSTGYGFSMIGTPILMIVYPAHAAIQINIILSILLSAFMIYNIRKEVDTKLLKRLMIGSLPGMVLGIFVYLYLDIDLLKVFAGIIIVILTTLLILKFTIDRTENRDFSTGGVSGLFTTSIGVPGPPLLLYFSGSHMDMVTLRSTTLAYYLFVYTASLGMQVTFGGTTREIWVESLIAVPALVAGIFLGQMLFRWISQRAFMIVTYVILIFSGLYLLVTGI